MQSSNSKKARIALHSSAIVLGMMMTFAAIPSYADIVVITNKASGMTALSQDQLANLYLGKPVRISSNTPVQVLDQYTGTPSYDTFYRAILDRSPTEMSRYWSNMTFSGQQVQHPQRVADDQAAIQAVLNTPGAIAYVDDSAITKKQAKQLNVVYDVVTFSSEPAVTTTPKHMRRNQRPMTSARASETPSFGTPAPKETVAPRTEPVAMKPKYHHTHTEKAVGLQQVSLEVPKGVSGVVVSDHIPNEHLITTSKSKLDRHAAKPLAMTKANSFTVVSATPQTQPATVQAVPVYHAPSTSASTTGAGNATAATSSTATNNSPFAKQLAALTQQAQNASRSLQQDAEKNGAIVAQASASASASAAAAAALTSDQTANNASAAGQTDDMDSFAHLSGPNLWNRIAMNGHLARYADDAAVQRQVQWFVQHPALLNRILLNARPFLYYIYQQTRMHHMPAEIALLPAVESGYDPYAYSRAGATGLWQLMPVAALTLGLRIDWWYDGRRDLVQSTNAALRYLQNLHNEFHSWPLALAAYDAGSGQIEAILKAARAQNKPTDLNSLPLPAETRNYLPNLLAIAEIIKNPGKYGVQLPFIPDRPYLTTVRMNSQVTMTQVANLTGITETQVQRLNAGLLRWATDPEFSYDLIVPISKVPLLRRGLTAIVGQKQLTWMYHEVRYGETLDSIAGNYRTDAGLLQKVNGLAPEQMIQPGQGLIVPIALNMKFNALGGGEVSPQISSNMVPQQGFVQQPADAGTSEQIKSGDSLRVILDKLHGDGY